MAELALSGGLTGETSSTLFGNVTQNAQGNYQPTPGYGSKTMAGLAGFAGGPVVGAVTTIAGIGADIYQYYANKRREKEAAEKEERRYQDYLGENKRRYDLEAAERAEEMKTNKMLALAGLNQGIVNRKDAIDAQNYSRYNDLKAGLNKMINADSYRNKFLSTWGA